MGLEGGHFNGSLMVRTDTSCSGVVGLVAHVAVASEGPDGVDTLAVFAQVGHHQALVDVWEIFKKADTYILYTYIEIDIKHGRHLTHPNIKPSRWAHCLIEPFYMTLGG